MQQNSILLNLNIINTTKYNNIQQITTYCAIFVVLQHKIQYTFKSNFSFLSNTNNKIVNYSLHQSQCMHIQHPIFIPISIIQYIPLHRSQKKNSSNLTNPLKIESYQNDDIYFKPIYNNAGDLIGNEVCSISQSENCNNRHTLPNNSHDDLPSDSNDDLPTDYPKNYTFTDEDEDDTLKKIKYSDYTPIFGAEEKKI